MFAFCKVGRYAAMSRRNFIVGVGSSASAACWPFAAPAQSASIPVIGYLQRPGPVRTDFEDFHDGLRALGYEQGRNIRIEQRYGELDDEKVRGFALELVRMNVRAIVVDGTFSIKTVMSATKTIPIVATLISGPSQFGIENLAHPGINLTGLSSFADDLEGKRIELLKELLPSARRVAVLLDRNNANEVRMGVLETAAQTLGVEVQRFEATGRQNWPEVFAAIAASRPDALLQVPSGSFASNPRELAGLAVAQRLPAMYGEREFVQAGGLMSYGISYSDQWRRAAGYVDRILKGAKAGDLPIEQPTKFDLVINLKAATSIGITVPTSIMLRAGEVIE